METTTGWVVKHSVPIDFRIVPNGTFRIPYTSKKSKTIDFFDDLYTYPPKFRVKWDTIDELHEDLFMSYNYRLHNTKFPFIEAVDDFFKTSDDDLVKKTTYTFDTYLEGYLNKITSTKFYSKGAKYLQKALQSVPVYAILNGQDEIVLATSTDSLVSTTTNANQLAYDFCGSFDPFIKKENQLGFFFLSRQDAEVYLSEIAKTDTQATKMLGLSIHCFGLDFAYRVTREYHPNVDFRFIPDLNHVQSLISSSVTGNSNLVFENGQQQLRFRRRPLNIIPISSSLNKWFSPFSSFLEKTEYYKGVPIYIVKVNEVSTNFITNRYYGIVNLIDNVYNRLINTISVGFGFGNNWILQSSLNDQNFESKMQTYIFFDQVEANEFCKLYNSKIARYRGKRNTPFEAFSKKPKILVHNLEDFLEMWEEFLVVKKNDSLITNQQGSLDFDTVKFISAKQERVNLSNYLEQDKKFSFKKVTQFFDFKYRRLKGFFEIFLTTN